MTYLSVIDLKSFEVVTRKNGSSILFDFRNIINDVCVIKTNLEYHMNSVIFALAMPDGLQIVELTRSKDKKIYELKKLVSYNEEKFDYLSVRYLSSGYVLGGTRCGKLIIRKFDDFPEIKNYTISTVKKINLPQSILEDGIPSNKALYLEYLSPCEMHVLSEDLHIEESAESSFVTRRGKLFVLA